MPYADGTLFVLPVAEDVKRPGFSEARLIDEQHWAVVSSDIQLLVLGGRQVTELLVEPLLVVEADPVQDSRLSNRPSCR